MGDNGLPLVRESEQVSGIICQHSGRKAHLSALETHITLAVVLDVVPLGRFELHADKTFVLVNEVEITLDKFYFVLCQCVSNKKALVKRA